MQAAFGTGESPWGGRGLPHRKETPFLWSPRINLGIVSGRGFLEGGTFRVSPKEISFPLAHSPGLLFQDHR